MRRAVIKVILGAVLSVSVLGAAKAPDLPKPRFDRVDYAHPGKYLDLPPKLGSAAAIRKAAADIKAATPRGKLGAIGAWITARLRNDPKMGYEYRDFDRILADGTFGGCQDHAEVFGALARACGIPAVWVKTMDADWIRMFRRTGDRNRTWSGHVFLEVHLDGKWALLDASASILYEDYDVRQRILPGNRFAYDKGGDYYELLMSDRWEDWKKQTAAHFADFDLAQLPVGEGAYLAPPGAVVVAGNNPAWQWAVDRVHELGLPSGGGGNAGFDEWIPRARDGWLVVLCQGGTTVLPEEYRGMLPDGWEVAVKGSASGVLRGKAPDGTRVVLVHAPDEVALRAELGKFTFEE